jgi:hypothetical protein
MTLYDQSIPNKNDKWRVGVYSVSLFLQILYFRSIDMNGWLLTWVLGDILLQT